MSRKSMWTNRNVRPTWWGRIFLSGARRMALQVLPLLCMAGGVSGAAELRGRVLDALDGRPLPSVHIQLRAAESTGQGSEARSGADGTYRMVDIEPGEYSVTFSKPGYEARGRRTESVSIAAENERVSRQLRLRPSAAVAGRVVDPWGDPAPGVAIQLRQWRSSGGIRQMQPLHAARTDDLGQFRLYDLPPGRYFLMAIPPPATAGASDAYYEMTPQYFPGVESAAAAGAITLDWGTVFEQAEIELEAAPDTVLVGSAALPEGGPCRDCQVMLEAGDSGFQTGVRPNEAGEFRIFGLPPGEYRALVRRRGNGVAFDQVTQLRDRPAQLALQLSHGATIHGTLLLEDPPEEDPEEESGGLPGRLGRGRYRGRGVQLTRIPPLSGERYDSQGEAENEFTVVGVPVGEYLVAPFEMPRGGYAAEALADGAPLPDWRLRVDPGRTDIELIVRVAFDGGRVAGKVGGDAVGPLDGLTVVLLPADYGGAQGYERYAQVNRQDGTFEFEGAPPGEYALGAVRREMRADWASVDQRAQFYDRGRAVRIAPRSSRQVDAPFLDGFR